MTTEDDVREMLAEQARSVRVSGDGWERIEEKLAAPSGRRPVPRTFLVAAAVFAVVLTAMAVHAARDRETRVELRPADEATTTIPVPAPVPATELPEGVWPWPSDDAQSPLTDPVETARAYVDARVGLSDTTTVSDYQAGDNSSGEVVFGGDISTTVFVRQLEGVWHVEGAVSDLVTVHDRGDGTSTARAEADGWLQSFVQLSTGDSSVVVPAQEVRAGYEVANGVIAFDLNTDRVVKRVRFLLTTAAGVKGLTEVGFRPPALASNDPREVVVDHLADRLDGRSVVVNEFAPTDATHGQVTWDAGVVMVELLDGAWTVTEAIGDSIQIAGYSRDAGLIDGTVVVAEAGTLHFTAGSTTWDVVVDHATEGTEVAFSHEIDDATSSALVVVFDTAKGSVSLAERPLT